MSFRPRRALVGLVAAAAALVALPAAASAAITPTLKLSQSGTTAGTNPTVGFDATFAGGTPSNVTLALPPGLLANENINGGACLVSKTPSSACQVGNGTVTLGTGVPVTIDLVAPPKAGDVGGLAVVSGTNALGTADVTLTATGLNVVLSGLPTGITEINTSLTNLRLPTSCPTSANVTLTADSVSTTAPLTVTGCSSLPYNPTVTASVTKDATGNGGAVTLAITQAANESANKNIVLTLPKGLAPNGAADIPCLSGKVCTIGTATATSPLVPNIALSNGVVTLSGTATAPTIAITFPTLGITIPGTVSLTTNSVTFANVPDVPLTSLTLNVTGPNGQKAFTTDCAPANVVGNFTAQGGQTHSSTAPIKFAGCAAKPSATGSTSGLAGGHPKLKFTVTHGKGGPNVATLAIGLPGGLRFSRAAIVSHKTCTTKGKKKKCITTTLIKGLGISGAKAASVAIRGGKLVIALKNAAGRVTITAAGPLVSETKGLQTKVKKHRVTSLNFSIKITDAKKVATTVSVKLRAH
ncbi:MAG: hypothetical protein JO286_04110 [Solirubrobacterales bacterium]|nr:hypothetical protein [Solirubrobacterales bacterium]